MDEKKIKKEYINGLNELKINFAKKKVHQPKIDEGKKKERVEAITKLENPKLFQIKYTLKKPEKNRYTMFDERDARQIYYDNIVEFESVESFYGDVDDGSIYPLICPRGPYNPYEVTSSSSIRQISNYSNDWINNSKFDLKCYYHREGIFLVFYLMNGENYVLRLSDSTLHFDAGYKFDDDVKEIYDFKLLNKQNTNILDTYNPYPFMALVKRNNYLQLIGTKFDFQASQQIIRKNIILLEINNYFF